MRTIIIFIGEGISSAVSFIAEYLECDRVTPCSCTVNFQISDSEKDHLTKYLDNTYSTSPIFIETTEEEENSIKNSLTLIIKK